MKIKSLACLATLCALAGFALVPVSTLAQAPSGAPAVGSDLLVHPSKMEIPPLDFTLPKAKRRVLSNGMVLFIREDHELPLVYLSATIRTGGYLEPDGKLGLAQLCGSVMRTGGTDAQTGDQIDEELEQMAASVETGIGEEAGSASMNVLTKDLDRTLEIYASVLMKPKFDAGKIELKRKTMLEEIRRRNDQPDPISRREWRRHIYAGTYRGRVSTKSTVEAITRDDLVAFHKRSFFPANMMLVASGDFQEEAFVAKLEKTFAGWAPAAQPVAMPPEIPLKLEPALYFIEKDVPQACIRIGHLGVFQTDPDWHALQVLDNILGGNGFVSRLMREVRSNRGLAYGVSSAITGGRTRGVVACALQTKSASCVEAIGLVNKIVADMTRAPVTADELKIAKDSILNSFVFGFTSSWDVVSQQAGLEYAGLPADWMETYRDKISAVTVADVQRVAAKHIHPDKMVLMVVGKSKDFDKKLDTLGKVTVLPLPDDNK